LKWAQQSLELPPKNSDETGIKKEGIGKKDVFQVGGRGVDIGRMQ